MRPNRFSFGLQKCGSYNKPFSLRYVSQFHTSIRLRGSTFPPFHRSTVTALRFPQNTLRKARLQQLSQVRSVFLELPEEFWGMSAGSLSEQRLEMEPNITVDEFFTLREMFPQIFQDFIILLLLRTQHRVFQ